MGIKEHNRGPSQRQLRLGELLRHTLAEVFLRTEIQDDDLRGASITVAEVRVSPDARMATAFVTSLGGRNQDAVVAALGRNRRFIRGEVARRVHLKYVPDLRFRLDDRFDHSARITKLLKESRRK